MEDFEKDTCDDSDERDWSGGGKTTVDSQDDNHVGTGEDGGAAGGEM